MLTNVQKYCFSKHTNTSWQPEILRTNSYTLLNSLKLSMTSWRKNASKLIPHSSQYQQWFQAFAVNSNLIECCLFNFQITKHFDFSIKFQVYWTGRCNLHYNSLLLQYQQLWQVSRAQHCAMQCWLPVAEKGSALKSLTPSQKLQEGQQKGAMSNTELSGLKEAFGQRCDHRTVLLTRTGHALPNQIGLL